MQGIETKDYILLALTVPAGLLTIWLAQLLTRFTDFGSKRIRLGRFKSEENKFRKVSELKQSEWTTSYIILECAYAAVAFLTGLLIELASFFVFIVDTIYRIADNLSLLSNAILSLIGFVGVVAGWRKYRRVYGYYLRLKNFDYYKASLNKRKAELFPQSNKPQTPPQAPSP